MIGADTPRVEGPDKLAGRTTYAADLRVPGMWHGATVRSDTPHGVLRAVRLGPGVPWDEVTVVTAADVPGKNRVAAIVDDQPFLVGVGEEIRHREQAVVLLAHADPEVLAAACAAVRLEVDPLPPVLGIEAALAADVVLHQPGNVFKEIHIQTGDPDPVWERAATVVSGEYHTGAQEHLYLETQAMVAETSEGPDGLTVTVRGSLQCPYYVHGAVRGLLGLPADRVRVVALDVGGAFGGKEDYPSLLAGHAALLAWRSGHPVRMVYDRAEDMAATTKRHPSRTRIRSAFDDDGRLLALDVDVVLDAGAYTTLSPVVLSRSCLHATGVYRCPHVRVHGRAVATTSPPPGAFRGFGAPQSLFAVERHLDVCAERLGLDPAVLRRRNLLHTGDAMATGQVVREDLDLSGLMDLALADIHYTERRAAFTAANAESPRVRRGVGLAVFLHGCGFTGSGETTLASVAGVGALPDGRVEVLTAATEMGQGRHTVLAQVAADALGLPRELATELVVVAPADTDRVPDSGPTVASRTTMVVGKLVETAARSFREGLVQGGLLPERAAGPVTAEGFREAVRRQCERTGGDYRTYAQHQTPPGQRWDDEHYRGDAYPTYAWACYAAQVAVDTLTWEVSVEDFVTVQEVGRVLNPTLATGQIQGGVAQGIGYGLWEEVVTAEGRMVNNQLANYAIATAADLPEIRVRFVENPHPAGPGGAKGIGELPMDGSAPAVLNALGMALDGVLPGAGSSALDTLPMTPERLLRRVRGGQEASS